MLLCRINGFRRIFSLVGDGNGRQQFASRGNLPALLLRPVESRLAVPSMSGAEIRSPFRELEIADDASIQIGSHHHHIQCLGRSRLLAAHQRKSQLFGQLLLQALEFLLDAPLELIILFDIQCQLHLLNGIAPLGPIAVLKLGIRTILNLQGQIYGTPHRVRRQCSLEAGHLP